MMTLASFILLFLLFVASCYSNHQLIQLLGKAYAREHKLKRESMDLESAILELRLKNYELEVQVIGLKKEAIYFQSFQRVDSSLRDEKLKALLALAVKSPNLEEARNAALQYCRRLSRSVRSGET